MLFVALIKLKSETTGRRLDRRAAWEYPDTIKKVAEYWLPMPDLRCIAVFESTSAVPIMECFYEWADEYDITIVPAITDKEGLPLAKTYAERD